MIVDSFSDGATDFRSMVNDSWIRKRTIIDTNFDTIKLVVHKTNYEYYVSIEHAELMNAESNWRDRVMGIVELIPKRYGKYKKVFEPHSFTVKEQRGNGYVESIYRWILNNGYTLVSGNNQSHASNGLWRKLSKDYECYLFDVNRYAIICEGDEFNVNASNTRLMLRKRSE
jgi:hypothetical protein